jgi:uncharacterized integral membrane protein
LVVKEVESMRARAGVIFVLLVLFLAAIAQNTKVDSFQILFWSVEMSRILALLIALLVGVVVGFLLGRPWKRRKRDQKRPSPSRTAE